MGPLWGCYAPTNEDYDSRAVWLGVRELRPHDASIDNEAAKEEGRFLSIAKNNGSATRAGRLTPSLTFPLRGCLVVLARQYLPG